MGELFLIFILFALQVNDFRSDLTLILESRPSSSSLALFFLFAIFEEQRQFATLKKITLAGDI